MIGQKTIVKRQYIATDKSFNFKPAPRPLDSRMPEIVEHSIPIEVRRYFTDVDGVIQAKGAVPATLQTKYPVWLLGEFDRNGGYSIAIKNVAPVPATYYLQTFVNGHGATSMSITGFSGLNDLQPRLKVGDIIHVFTDDLVNPNYFIWIVVSSTYTALASVIANLQTTQKDYRFGRLYSPSINFFTDSQSQWDEPMHYTRADNLGTWKDDTVQPYVFRNPFTEQQGFLTISTQIEMDQYQGINFYMIFAADLLTLDFKIIKQK